MKVLVLGVSGLIGNNFLKVLSQKTSLDVFGTVRSESYLNHFKSPLVNKILTGIDLNDYSKIIDTLGTIRPDVVINCIGATKHEELNNNPIDFIRLNALFPHQLAKTCTLLNARLIHISTDCVFSGKKGLYNENDLPDSYDIYGRSKLLGEVIYGNALTLRLSTIGHELNSNNGLLNWFLAQENECKGFKNAVFSGLPAVVVAEIIRDLILDKKDLRGIYHIGATAINKYDLLKLIANIYKKEINIEMDEELVIDRSLDSTKFKSLTGFEAPKWQDLIQSMYKYQL